MRVSLLRTTLRYKQALTRPLSVLHVEASHALSRVQICPMIQHHRSLSTKQEPFNLTDSNATIISDASDESDNSDSDEELDQVDEEEAAEGREMAAKYLGVVYTPTKVKKYSAELEMDGLIISGGHYWTALDAAKGYDELVDLYCDLESPRNFSTGSSESTTTSLPTSSTEWVIPDVGKRNAAIIPPIPQTYLSIDEVIQALERENAIDIYTINLQGKSSLAEYMVFTTGRSTVHMRRMADMMIGSMKARNLSDDFEYSVEGRDCDDWMIADCNTIVVHFMQAETRRILNLEDHWENMENDRHRIYGHMDEEEYMDKYGTSELMEYIDDEDFIRVEPHQDVESVLKQQEKDIDWK